MAVPIHGHLMQASVASARAGLAAWPEAGLAALLAVLPAALLGVLVALAVAPAAILGARRFRILDHPDGSLKPHGSPIPRTGGWMLVAAVLIGSPAAALFLGLGLRPMIPCLLGAALAFAVGVLDDLAHLSAGRKFLLLAIAAVPVVLLGGGGMITRIPWIDAALSVACLVAGANALNLIDGRDGLAGGLTAIAAASLTWLLLLSGNVLASLGTAALGGGALVFLWFNRTPARLFLGDGGSLCAGFLLAQAALLMTRGERGDIRFTAALLALAIPILDTAAVVIRRLATGRPLFAADRSHTYDSLANACGDRLAVAIFIVTGALAAVLALRYASLARLLPPLALAGAASTMFTAYALFEFRRQRHALPPTRGSHR